jgi:hypothetical protein
MGKEVPQMQKKWITTCVAIAAFAAFVVAPAASASPVLTSEGKAVAVGTSVTGSNTGIFKFEGGGGYTIDCSSVDLAANVTGNSGTKIQLEAAAGGFTTSGTATGGDCTASWGPAKLTWGKMCLVTSAGTDNVTVTGCGAGIALTTNITGTSICQYSAASGTGTVATSADAQITVNSLPEQKTEGSGLFCPSEVRFSMIFDLTATGGGTLFIS